MAESRGRPGSAAQRPTGGDKAVATQKKQYFRRKKVCRFCVEKIDDINNLGNRGQVVKVASGYARNFLLPRKMAVAATETNKKIVEQERQAHLRRDTKLKGEAEDLAKMVNGA